MLWFLVDSSLTSPSTSTKNDVILAYRNWKHWQPGRLALRNMFAPLRFVVLRPNTTRLWVIEASKPPFARTPTPATSDQRKNQKMDLMQEKMCKLMPEALSALKGVKTVVWEMCSINPEWASILVLDFLALTPGISDISFLRGESDVLATKFFTQVLPRLSKTLVSLRISASFEGLWCFGQHSVDILLECKQLLELTIPVYTSEGNAGVLPYGSYQNLGKILNQTMNMVAQRPAIGQAGRT
ncbi:hypothetical protein BD779DRAFT_312296 [Infundibulicybe gibba]|nr:hypothetical protein BD779DRAFT_312296 [Infundibulicybe gibba]